MTDNFDVFIKEYSEDNYKLSINCSSNIYSQEYFNCINLINYLFSFYPYKDHSLILECSKEIINLYEKMGKSKYNSAIQKYFIQLKEIKEELIFEHPIIFSEKEKNASLFPGFVENQNKVQDDTLDDNIKMVIID